MFDLVKEIEKLGEPYEKVIIVPRRMFEELMRGNPSDETLAYFEWAKTRFRPGF